MTRTWQIQDAKARFSEFVEASLTQGPQIVTRRGRETAVLVPIAQWRRLEKLAGAGLKSLLLSPHARVELLTPPRKPQRLRTPPVFE
ncbi:MAG: type II toxin-antitoxin system Phd/YefM family antitoxin [Pseudomonadota bacterium]